MAGTWISGTYWNFVEIVPNFYILVPIGPSD